MWPAASYTQMHFLPQVRLVFQANLAYQAVLDLKEKREMWATLAHKALKGIKETKVSLVIL